MPTPRSRVASRMTRADSRRPTHRCTTDFAGGVRLLNDNKVYRQDHTVPREWFAQHVLGKVVALIKVQDHHLLNGEPYPTMQPVRGI